jgi:hypothetical protein
LEVIRILVLTSKRKGMMIQNRNLVGDLELYPKSEVNEVMEQNPSKKTGLMSVKGTDVEQV